MSFKDWKQEDGLHGYLKSKQKDMVVLKELLEAGKVAPMIERRYQLSETAAAKAYLEEGHAQGKAIINMETSDKS